MLSKERGIGESPCNFVEVLQPQFSPKFIKNDLKWHLAYLFFYKNFKNHTAIQNFFKMERQSNLTWQRKIFSFKDENFWKSMIFDQHGQYIHQMKAEIISNWYLVLKSTLRWKKIAIIECFKIFYLYFTKKKSWMQNFSKFFVQPPKFCFHLKW